MEVNIDGIKNVVDFEATETMDEITPIHPCCVYIGHLIMMLY
jgi:hypothetical protein